MKFLAALALVLTLLIPVPAAHADSLKRTKVSGVLWVDGNTDQDDFYQTSSKIGPGVEFTGTSLFGSAGNCSYFVNFSAAKVGITDKCFAVSTFALPEVSDQVTFAHDNFEMSFTDPALLGDAITPIKNGLGLTYSLTGDTLDFDLTNGDATSNKSTFAITTAVTPEPPSWQLLVLGLGSMLGFGFMAKSSSSRDVVDRRSA